MGGLFGGGSKPVVQEAPKPVEIKQAEVQQDVIDRNAEDIIRRRRGTAATVTGAADIGTTAGNVASKTLLGN